MLRINNIFILALLFLFCLSCEEEQDLPVLNKDYPVLVTKEASDIDESGVTLSAQITVPDGEIITSFGFEVRLGRAPIRIDISGWKEIEDFSYRLASNMIAGDEYEFKPFAVSSNYTVYGEPMTFTSQGQLGPEIMDFYPKQATVFDEITVIGRNFNLNQVILRLGNDRRLVNSGGRTSQLINGEVDTVRFIPGTQALGFENLSVSIVSDGITSTASQPLELIKPEITDINRRKGFAAESEFSISLNNISLDGLTGLQVGFREGGSPGATLEPAKILGVSDNTITFKSEVSTGTGMKDLFIYPLPNLEINAGTIELAPRWEKISELPSDTEQDLAAVIGGKVYFLSREEFWQYNPVTNTWTGLETYPGNNVFGAQVAFAIDNYIYYGLGFYNDFYRYDTNTGVWQRLNDAQVLLSVDIQNAVISGKYYALSQNNGRRLKFTYNPENDSWTRDDIDLPRSFRYFDQAAPNFVFNNSFHFVNGPRSSENGGINIYKVDLTNNETSFSLIETLASSPFDIDGVTSNNLGAFIDNKAIISIGLGTFSARGVSLLYDLSTKEASALSPILTTEMYKTFETDGELYGIRLYPGGTEMNELYKFKKEID